MVLPFFDACTVLFEVVVDLGPFVPRTDLIQNTPRNALN
ncbi:Uncharacterised protein [BD1-7 clade bacterium]|uniref:Uncharacterized protein n=1 Tax=BD1-7 clade bacterium TaxID=2029982 RepID=A0A5S9NYW4_9GAMM|nr:Uncharacterised protein [BD1-7 clade bacterium]CAA0096055.1 Uncharacterised protein [BD1-7 clade bacterium]